MEPLVLTMSRVKRRKTLPRQEALDVTYSYTIPVARRLPALAPKPKPALSTEPSLMSAVPIYDNEFTNDEDE
jgi:hypothetical protein